MLRHSLVFGLLLVAAGASRADFEGVLDERLHDFGVVPRGQQLTHYFRVANPTNKTLHISGVRVSCGCTSARALQTSLAPGQETAVYAVMDSRRFVGAKQVTIFVTFDQPRFEELRTVVQAFAREDIIFSPDTLTFGKIKQGDTKNASMNITMFNGSVKITDAKSESNYIVPTVKEVRRSGNETVYQIEAAVRSDTPVGLWFSDIWVTTNNSGFAKLRVPVTVEVEGLQPVRNEGKKVDGPKTSKVEPATRDVSKEPVIPVQSEEPAISIPPTNAPAASTPPTPTAPVAAQPTSESRPAFPFFGGLFRR